MAYEVSDNSIPQSSALLIPEIFYPSTSLSTPLDPHDVSSSPASRRPSYDTPSDATMVDPSYFSRQQADAISASPVPPLHSSNNNASGRTKNSLTSEPGTNGRKLQTKRKKQLPCGQHCGKTFPHARSRNRHEKFACPNKDHMHVELRCSACGIFLSRPDSLERHLLSRDHLETLDMQRRKESLGVTPLSNPLQRDG